MTRRPIVPSENERRENPRSRSARLRAAEKVETVEPVAGP
jgi:16S rRNA C1402 N4-methylase RsmH